MRTHFCGDVNEHLQGQNITVCGWAQTRRDHGGVIFIDLRDAKGVLQLVAAPADGDAFVHADKVRSEYVLRAGGQVRARPDDAINPHLASGKVELQLSHLEILNSAHALPFLPNDDNVSEETRLRNRVIDLRGATMQANLRRRHAMLAATREWLCARDFVEIETPILTRATPEGARDFLSPSRLQAGGFYALPQSPQLFKQMLMAAGFERYFQMARCFRDEDLRADRQPEFSQIDLEMAFVAERDVMTTAEEMTITAFAAAGVNLPAPIPQMTWAEAMRRFGNDRPDLRNPLELTDLGDVMAAVEFKVFREPAQAKDGRVVALRLPQGGSLSRKDIDELTDFVGRFGARGLAYIKINSLAAGADGLQSPIVKFLPPEVLTEILTRTAAADGDLLFFGAGRADVVNSSMSALRDKLGRERGLLTDGWRPLWITDFPLLEWDYDGKRWNARHHPFTAPQADSAAQLAEAPQNVLARAYDLTLNGVEIGGGSIRNHCPGAQLAMLAALGMDAEQAQAQFGFLLKTLAAGAPPHGGIAFGIDRMAAMASGVASIRDVIAFPKTQRGQCLLTDAPSAVTAEQLRELHIQVKNAPAANK